MVLFSYFGTQALCHFGTFSTVNFLHRTHVILKLHPNTPIISDGNKLQDYHQILDLINKKRF